MSKAKTLKRALKKLNWRVKRLLADKKAGRLSDIEIDEEFYACWNELVSLKEKDHSLPELPRMKFEYGSRN